MALGGAVGLALVGGMSEGTAQWWAVPVAVIAAGLPDVLDSQHAAGREPMGLSWSSIRYTMRRHRKSGVDVVLIPLRALGALVVDVVARIIPHRGLTHWLVTWFLLSALITEVSTLAGWGLAIPLAFSLGYLSHLVADCLTFSGVPLLGPLSSRSFHLLPRGLRFRYDSPVQWLIVLAVYGLVLCLRYPEQIQPILRGLTQ